MIDYIARKGTNSVKWDGIEETFGSADLLPLWVADMDFAVDKHITEALRAYVDQQVYGYYRESDSYRQAFINWERSEHGLRVHEDWIRFSPGVVPGFHYALQILTQAGDSVMISTPVYYPFTNAIKNNNLNLVRLELVNDGGYYSIDFADFEQKIVANDVKVYILCSPHNPVGRVWTEQELTTLLEVCRRHGVTVISDEIHHDLIIGDKKHIPTLALADDADKIIMLTAASKTFNIAGLQNSIVVIKNDELRAEWDRYAAGISLGHGNALGYIATEAAYTHGKAWLTEIKDIIRNNYDEICGKLTQVFPQLVISPLEGTYLAWADFGAYFNEEELTAFMQDKCGLAFDYGSWFGGDKSGSFIRINLATSKENIQYMIDRIVRAFNAGRQDYEK